MIISSFPAALGERDTGAALCTGVIHTLTGSGRGNTEILMYVLP